MASNMQSPESFQKESIHTFERCHSGSLQLPSTADEGNEANKAFTHQEIHQIHRPFSIGSSSPLSNDYEDEDEDAWQDRLDLPLTDFQRYDGQPPSCSAYETIVSNEMDEGLRETESNYSYCFSHESSDLNATNINANNSSVDVAIDAALEGSDENACLEWPTIQQEALSFNELSDVISDTGRLSKETSVLLQILDEGNLPPTVVVCVGNDVLAGSSAESNSLLNSSHVQQSMQQGNQSNQIITETQPSLNVYQNNTGCSYSDERQSYVGDSRYQRVPFASKIDYRGMATKPIHNFHELANEAKMERQHRRKEKNRECSRNFRYKQRLKEDCLKKGKLEKEVFLRSRLYERERLRSALVELARNCASCPKAMEFLSQYSDMYDKENLPTAFEGQIRHFTS